jgi:hypothetical protein
MDVRAESISPVLQGGQLSGISFDVSVSLTQKLYLPL